MSDDLRELGAYLDAFEEPTLQGNIGLYARQNLVAPSAQRRGNVRRISAAQAGFSGGFSAVPTSWASLAVVQQAVKVKADKKLADASGGQVVVLGKPRNVGGKSLKAGDQFFFQPATNKVEEIKTLAQLKTRSGPLSLDEQEAKANDPGRGNVWENAQNLRAILRSLGSPVISTGPADPELVQEWQRIATAHKLNPSVNAKTGDARLAVSAPTLSLLRVRARNVGRTPPPAKVAPQAPQGPAAAKYSSAPKGGGTVVALVEELQQLLKGIGYSKLVQDGKWGPATASAWKAATTRRRLNPVIARADGTHAWVYSASLNAMRGPSNAAVAPAPVSSTTSGNTAKTPKPAPTPSPKSAESVPVGDTVVATAEVQGVLRKLGAPKAGLTDGVFGKNTFAAYAAQAVKLGKDPLIAAAPGTKGRKSGLLSQTWGAIKAAASMPVKAAAQPTGKSASGKSDQPSAAGMTKTSVGQVQDIVRKLGDKLTRDGEWGPKTQHAWRSAAAKRKLDRTIDRAGPMEAWVMPATFAALAAAAGAGGTKPEAKKPISAQKVEPTALVEVPTDKVKGILSAFGSQPILNPEALVTTWNGLAKRFGLDGTSTVAGGVFKAVPKTYQRLLAEATLLQGASMIVQQSTGSVTVLALQKALAVANVTGDFKGKFARVKTTGKLDSNTFASMLLLFKTPLAQVPYWNKAKAQLSSADGKTLKLQPPQVSVVNGLAAQYNKNKTAVASATKAQVAQDKAASTDIDKAVSRADATVSVFTLQQAMNEVRLKVVAGTIKAPPGTPAMPKVGLTGKWDSATSKALLISFADKIWGGVIPQSAAAWPALIKRLLVNTKTLAVPSGVATMVHKLAQNFVARSATQQPSDETIVQGKKIVVRGRKPPPDVTREHLQPSTDTELAPAPTPAPAPIRPAPSFDTDSARPAPVYTDTPMPDIPVPGPTPSEPDAPVAGGGGSMFGLALIGGGILLALLMGGQKPDEREMPN